jgi:hypothetical protein
MFHLWALWVSLSSFQFHCCITILDYQMLIRQSSYYEISPLVGMNFSSCIMHY